MAEKAYDKAVAEGKASEVHCLQTKERFSDVKLQKAKIEYRLEVIAF